jgi:sugar lactone lactonase YvrE
MFYITDWRAQAVVEIEKLRRESEWRALTPPWPAGSLLEPAGVALADDGRLIVADRGHRRLVVFSSDRASAFALAPDGDPIGSLWQPSGISIGRDGDVLIADTGNHCIVRCSSVDAPAWTTFGVAGAGDGQFVAPSGVAMDAAGRITIADPGSSRLVRVDSMDGGGWVELPLPPASVTARPYGCAFGLGGILVTDPGASRVLLVADDGAGGSISRSLRCAGPSGVRRHLA